MEINYDTAPLERSTRQGKEASTICTLGEPNHLCNQLSRCINYPIYQIVAGLSVKILKPLRITQQHPNHGLPISSQGG